MISNLRAVLFAILAVGAALLAVSCNSGTAAVSRTPTLSTTSILPPVAIPTAVISQTTAPTRLPTIISIPTISPTPTEIPLTARTATAPSQRTNLDAVAPPGRERDLILQNCGNCHSFVCAFRGQRTVEHWETVKQDMRDKVTHLSDQDYNAMFAYLEANFDDHKPEPNLPPELQELGCSSGVR